MTKAKCAPGAAPRAARKRTPRNWRAIFLEALAATSNVAASARKAGIAQSQVYKIRRADMDFARAWQEALCEGYDNLEMDLLHRLRSGEAEPRKGKANRRFENGTALRLLTVHREAVKRERGRREMADEEAVLASIRAKIAAIQAREAAFADLLAEERAAAAPGPQE